MKFTEFSLHEDLLKGIAKAGYETCTPVQEQVIKIALNKQDLYVQSQTGTGKTAAYLITIIQEMLIEKAENHKQALIMVPTRELAVQVEDEARILLSGTQFKAGSFYGGVGYGHQVTMLSDGIDIIIGTPGRVIDLNESGQMKLNNIGYLIIDEADRMFDMGFYPDLRKLIKVLPVSKNRQTMLFSATLNTYVKNLAWEYTTEAQEIEIESKNITVSEINQMIFHVPSDDKIKLLLGIISKEKPDSIIVFCNTKRSCEVIAKRLKMNGIECEFIIGDLPQSKRLQVLDSFKRGSLKCLVATDVAARGIDVNDLSMVVNYDLPNEAENYIHRIGRTARAGKTGTAYTFCSEQDVYNLPAIERYVGTSIPSQVAVQDMYGEDKSSGTYIHTGNFNDDRYGQRNSRQTRGTSRNYSEHSNNRSNNHDTRNHTTSGPRRDENKSNMKNTRTNYNNRAENQRNDHRTENRQNVVAVDMSQMSFEERMKLYREKYSKQDDRNLTSVNKTANSNYTKTSSDFIKNKPQNMSRKPNSANEQKKGKTPENRNNRNFNKKRNYRNNEERYSKNNTTRVNNTSTTQKTPKPSKKQKPPRKGVGNIFTRIFTFHH
jgi:ATP-dependent RNA helicase RhlB